jgi:hypothetical protein
VERFVLVEVVLYGSIFLKENLFAFPKNFGWNEAQSPTTMETNNPGGTKGFELRPMASLETTCLGYMISPIIP